MVQSFYKNLFVEEHEAEKCPNSDKEHAKNILGLRKGEEFLIWILHKIMYKFVLNLFVYYYNTFLQTSEAVNSIKRTCASGWFCTNRK